MSLMHVNPLRITNLLILYVCDDATGWKHDSGPYPGHWVSSQVFWQHGCAGNSIGYNRSRRENTPRGLAEARQVRNATHKTLSSKNVLLFINYHLLVMT